jgi:hypothetical protein
MLQKVRLIPETSEGYFVAKGLRAPLPFTVEVGHRGNIGDFPIDGWDGRVVEGQSQFLGKRVILTYRIEGHNSAVVAYIFATEGIDRQIFSGTCRTKGLV